MGAGALLMCKRYCYVYGYLLPGGCGGRSLTFQTAVARHLLIALRESLPGPIHSTNMYEQSYIKLHTAYTLLSYRPNAAT